MKEVTRFTILVINRKTGGELSTLVLIIVCFTKKPKMPLVTLQI